MIKGRNQNEPTKKDMWRADVDQAANKLGFQFFVCPYRALHCNSTHCNTLQAYIGCRPLQLNQLQHTAGLHRMQATATQHTAGLDFKYMQCSLTLSFLQKILISRVLFTTLSLHLRALFCKRALFQLALKHPAKYVHVCTENFILCSVKLKFYRCFRAIILRLFPTKESCILGSFTHSQVHVSGEDSRRCRARCVGACTECQQITSDTNQTSRPYKTPSVTSLPDPSLF